MEMIKVKEAANQSQFVSFFRCALKSIDKVNFMIQGLSVLYDSRQPTMSTSNLDSRRLGQSVGQAEQQPDSFGFTI